VIEKFDYASAARHRESQNNELMDRRTVVLGLIGACSGTFASALPIETDTRSVAETLSEWLHSCGARLFADLRALRRLGALYLVAHPHERSRAVLSHLLIGGDEGSIQWRILSAIDRDWRGHHVVVVDGWLLARTEARLCATLHLESGIDT
jgi:hypothetical protein